MKTSIVRAALAVAMAFAVVAPALASQDPPSQGTINLPPEELKAYEPINAAATAADAIAAAKAFIAKYPKSPALPQVEIVVYNKILDSPKDATRLGYNGEFKKMFPASDRGLDLELAMFDYYLKEGKLAEINKANEARLAKTPDDVRTHLLLLTLSVEAIKRQDGSLLESGKSHGKRAIELFEGTTRPSVFKDDAEWQAYKTANVGVAYQSYAVVGLASNDLDMATQYFEKAIAASPADPLNYFYLANVKHNVDYIPLAKKYNEQQTQKSPEAPKTLEAVNAALDREMLLLAKAVSYSEANPTYTPILQQAKPMLEEVYKQRHGGKLDGMDEYVKNAKGAQ